VGASRVVGVFCELGCHLPYPLLVDTHVGFTAVSHRYMHIYGLFRITWVGPVHAMTSLSTNFGLYQPLHVDHIFPGHPVSHPSMFSLVYLLVSGDQTGLGRYPRSIERISSI
jgi:hypothetical protein